MVWKGKWHVENTWVDYNTMNTSSETKKSSLQNAL